MKYVCVIGGVLGLILGAIAGYIQTETERNETHAYSPESYTNTLAYNPKVLSIEVIGNE